MKAIIEVEVPEWQIGQKVSVFFPDSMVTHSVCMEKQDFKEWLQTFNTESATECFTTVQRLKESVNDRLDEGYKG